MTDNDIIKSLECCAEVDECAECPLCEKCNRKVFNYAIDLINRQKAEIEENNLKINHQAQMIKIFERALEDKVAEIERYKRVIKILEKDVADAETEAVKEFAKLIIDKAKNGVIYAMDIPDYVREMVGE